MARKFFGKNACMVLAFFLGAQVVSATALSDPSHSEAKPEAAKNQPKGQYYVGDGTSFDLAIDVNEDGKARLYLFSRLTNEPIADATISLQGGGPGGTDLSFKAGTEIGVYEAKLEHSVSLPASVIIQTPTDADALDLAIPPYRNSNVGLSESVLSNQPKEDGSTRQIVLVGLLSLGAGLLLGLAIAAVWRRRRHRDTSAKKARQVAALILMGSLLGVGNREAFAHGGHDHGGSASKKESTEDLAGTATVLSKKSQMLLGLRTVAVQKQPTSDFIQAYGHIVPKPQNDALIVAPQAGYIRGLKGLLPGRAVKRGEVLGYLQSVAQVPLVSPIAGEITEAQAVEGSRVEAGTKLLRITNRSPLWVDAELFQAQLGNLSDVEKIVVSVDGYPEPISAKLINAPTPINEVTRTAKVYLELVDDPKEIRLGSFVKIHFTTASRGEGLLLPTKAVLNRAGERVVFIKTGPETFEPRSVAVSESAEPGVLVVTSGISEGERVVTSGNYQLLLKAK